MSVSLDATPGSTVANAYCTADEADAYHAAHPYGASWASATADQKAQAIILATALLDELVAWSGVVNTRDQKLLWPRFGVYGRNAWLIDQTIVPPEVKEATAEYA